MKNSALFRSLAVVVLLALSASASQAAQTATCPASGAPLPTVEERQFLAPIDLLHCYMSADEIAAVRASIGHNAQETVTDPAYDSGKLNLDGTPRPPLDDAMKAALTRLHLILDKDMRAGAIVRKFVQNSDVGGILYGRTVITSNGTPLVVTTGTVRGFVGLQRNTQGLDAATTVGALGLDYETAAAGQYSDATPDPLRRQVALEIQAHGLHSIRHTMNASGASAAKIPLGKDLNDPIQSDVRRLSGRSFEMDRQGQSNPYTALGMSDDIQLLVFGNPPGDDAIYPLHVNEEDVMTTPTPLAAGDMLLRRTVSGQETMVARYVEVANQDGSTSKRWRLLTGRLTPAEIAYYEGLIAQAAARVAGAGG
ncbi:MAG TPA: hypothetical protein VGE98_01750 [Thermoanaerobaculia bacterium]